MAKIKLFLSLLFCGAMLAQAQTDNGMLRMDEFRNAKKRPIIQIPDFGGFQTLKCDFHMHTVFSDRLSSSGTPAVMRKWFDSPNSQLFLYYRQIRLA